MQIKDLLKNKKFNIVFKYSSIKYIALIMGFAKGIINAKGLGPELLGVLGNLLLVLNYLSYCNLGIIYSMNREYPLYKIRNDRKADEVLNTTFTFTIFITILLLIFGGLSFVFFYRSTLRIYMVLIFLIAALEQFRMFFNNYFRLKDKYRQINLIELINNILTFVIVVLLISNYKIYGVLISMFLADVVVFIYGYTKADKFRFKIDFKILKDLIYIGVPLLIYNLGFYILTTVDRIMIIKFLNYSDLGYYTFSNQIVNATLVFMSSVLYLYYPKAITNLNVIENRATNLVLRIRQYTRYLETAGIVLCTLGMILINPFVNIIVPAYKVSISLYQILLIGIIGMEMSYFANVFIVSNKKQVSLIKLQAISIILAIALNYIFLKLGLGVYGIAYGTMITSIIYSIMQHRIFLKILRYKKIKSNIIKIYLKFFIFVLLALLLTTIHISFTLSTIILLSIMFILYRKNIYELKNLL